MALAVVRVSSGYFAVLDVSRTVCKKDFVLRAGVRISSQYFPVLYCVSFSCARKRSWLYARRTVFPLGLGLAVDPVLQCIIQCAM